MIVEIKKYTDEECSFKEIKENPIVLDFSQCRYFLQVHELLKEKFGLPEYYGKNWDALWDCLSYLFYDRGDIEVHIYGYRTMPDDWQEECIKMLEIFDDVHKETPNVVFKLLD